MLEKGIAIGREGYLGEVLWQFPKRTNTTNVRFTKQIKAERWGLKS